MADPLKCNYCGGVISPDVSNCHHCGHKTPFSCSVCNKTFGGPLGKRSNSPGVYHNGIVYCLKHSPFQCCVCGDKFTQVSTKSFSENRKNRTDAAVLYGEKVYCKNHYLQRCYKCKKMFPISDLKPKVVELKTKTITSSGGRDHSGSSMSFRVGIRGFFCKDCSPSHVEPSEVRNRNGGLNYEDLYD